MDLSPILIAFVLPGNYYVCVKCTNFYFVVYFRRVSFSLLSSLYLTPPPHTHIIAYSLSLTLSLALLFSRYNAHLLKNVMQQDFVTKQPNIVQNDMKRKLKVESIL
jgi:hypothetical protein